MAAALTHEVELKLAVDDDAALQRVASAAGGSALAPVLQENTLFDTQSLALDKARFTVRVRLENGVARLTFKGPSSGAAPSGRGQGGSAALTNRVEEEWIVSSGEAQQMLAGEMDPLYWLQERQDLNEAQRALCKELTTLAGGSPLTAVATFQNERQRVQASLEVAGRSVPVTLELDRTTYPDGSTAAEVELELEAGADAAAVERALHALFERAQVKPSTTTSKAARVFAWVRAQKRHASDGVVETKGPKA